MRRGFHDVFQACLPLVAFDPRERRLFRKAVDAGKLDDARRLLIDAGLAEDPTEELVPIILERRAKLVARLMKDAAPLSRRRAASDCAGRDLPLQLLPEKLKQAWCREDVKTLRAQAQQLRIEIPDLVRFLLLAEAWWDIYESIFARTAVLLSLTFDHSASPDPSSALHIRDVCKPEWQAGVTDP